MTNKGEMKHYSNQRGAGKLFSIDLLDGEGDEIRGTFFNESADKFYDALQTQQVT